MPGIDQLQFIPAGTGAPSSESYSEQAQGELGTTRPYAPINVRKTLDTTPAGSPPLIGCALQRKDGERSQKIFGRLRT